MFNFLKKLASPFKNFGFRLGDKLRSLFAKPIDESSYEELERLFYEADLGVQLSGRLVELVRKKLSKEPKTSSEELLEMIRCELLAILGPVPKPVPLASLHVILVVGVNGSGKTTSLAKLSSHYSDRKVLIAAADTFRAASVEQLERWAAKTHADLIKSRPGSDPSAVVFDALSAAQARHTEVVLIDTAGRLQTKTELMDELAKVRRICQKQIPGSPHETLLVIDATIGQNALDQAMAFHKYTPLTGIILTKLDGSAKGGIAIAIQQQLNVPIRWIGTGENASDLEPFDPNAFINALLNLSGK